MSVRVFPSRRVVCEATVHLPMSATTAWGQLRDFQSSAAHDPFHSGFSIEGGVARRGAKLRIEHRYLFARTERQGKIIFWREGVGFSFSDLSMRSVRGGFPHMFSLRLFPIDGQQCRLIVKVTGHWTFIGPRIIAWLWLTWVFDHTVRRTRNLLLQFAVARRRTAKKIDRKPGS
jgi:hypothetical protein